MKWKPIVAVVVLLVAVVVAVGIVRDWRVDGDFPAIPAKSTEAQVKQILGEPGAVERSCRVFDIQLLANCDHVFIYRSSLAPLRDKYWLVFFDGNNQATATSTEMEP